MAMVCSCHAVSERRIARAIDHGARSVTEVAVSCRAGSSCGGCHGAIEAMIAERCAVPVESTQVTVAVA